MKHVNGPLLSLIALLLTPLIMVLVLRAASAPCVGMGRRRPRARQASRALTRASTHCWPRTPRSKLVASGFGLNEGTTWVRDGKGSGFLLVGGLLDNVLYKIAPDNTVSVFMEKAGYTGTDVENVGAQTRAGRSHVLLIGPSCSGVDPQGRIIWCADNDRKVMRLEKDGTHTVLSEGGEGKRFNGPNDISIRSDGAIYLADNDFGLRGAGKSPLKELQDGIWRIKDGQTTRVLSDTQLGGIPNGITFSPDEKYLYLDGGQPDQTLRCEHRRNAG